MEKFLRKRQRKSASQAENDTAVRDEETMEKEGKHIIHDIEEKDEEYKNNVEVSADIDGLQIFIDFKHLKHNAIFHILGGTGIMQYASTYTFTGLEDHVEVALGVDITKCMVFDLARLGHFVLKALMENGNRDRFLKELLIPALKKIPETRPSSYYNSSWLFSEFPLMALREMNKKNVIIHGNDCEAIGYLIQLEAAKKSCHIMFFLECLAMKAGQNYIQKMTGNEIHTQHIQAAGVHIGVEVKIKQPSKKHWASRLEREMFNKDNREKTLFFPYMGYEKAASTLMKPKLDIDFEFKEPIGRISQIKSYYPITWHTASEQLRATRRQVKLSTMAFLGGKRMMEAEISNTKEIKEMIQECEEVLGYLQACIYGLENMPLILRIEFIRTAAGKFPFDFSDLTDTSNLVEMVTAWIENKIVVGMSRVEVLFHAVYYKECLSYLETGYMEGAIRYKEINNCLVAETVLNFLLDGNKRSIEYQALKVALFNQTLGSSKDENRYILFNPIEKWTELQPTFIENMIKNNLKWPSGRLVEYLTLLKDFQLKMKEECKEIVSQAMARVIINMLSNTNRTVYMKWTRKERAAIDPVTNRIVLDQLYNKITTCSEKKVGSRFLLKCIMSSFERYGEQEHIQDIKHSLIENLLRREETEEDQTEVEVSQVQYWASVNRQADEAVQGEAGTEQSGSAITDEAGKEECVPVQSAQSFGKETENKGQRMEMIQGAEATLRDIEEKVQHTANDKEKAVQVNERTNGEIIIFSARGNLSTEDAHCTGPSQASGITNSEGKQTRKRRSKSELLISKTQERSKQKSESKNTNGNYWMQFHRDYSFGKKTENEESEIMHRTKATSEEIIVKSAGTSHGKETSVKVIETTDGEIIIFSSSGEMITEDAHCAGPSQASGITSSDGKQKRKRRSECELLTLKARERSKQKSKNNDGNDWMQFQPQVCFGKETEYEDGEIMHRTKATLREIVVKVADSSSDREIAVQQSEKTEGEMIIFSASGDISTEHAHCAGPSQASGITSSEGKKTRKRRSESELLISKTRECSKQKSATKNNDGNERMQFHRDDSFGKKTQNENENDEREIIVKAASTSQDKETSVKVIETTEGEIIIFNSSGEMIIEDAPCAGPSQASGIANSEGNQNIKRRSECELLISKERERSKQKSKNKAGNDWMQLQPLVSSGKKKESEIKHGTAATLEEMVVKSVHTSADKELTVQQSERTEGEIIIFSASGDISTEDAHCAGPSQASGITNNEGKKTRKRRRESELLISKARERSEHKSKSENYDGNHWMQFQPDDRFGKKTEQED